MAGSGQLTLVRSTADAADLLSWLGERRDWLACDLETTGLNVGRDRIRLAQFADRDRGWAIPYGDWRGLVVEVLSTYRDGPIVFHNALFDVKFLRRDGVRVPQHLVHDTMVMAHLDDPVRRMGLKALGQRHLGPEWTAGEEALKLAFGSAGWDFETVPVDFPGYWQYGALDTVLTARIAEVLWPRIDRYRRAYDVELGFIDALADAEVAGMAVDRGYCEHALGVLRPKVAMLRSQIDAALPPGEHLNPLSDGQVVRALQAQGAVLTRRTERGQLSTDEDVLKGLSDTFPIAKLILECRKASFLVSSHFEKMLELAVERDGVLAVHPSTKSVGARTGRTTVTEPALQTIPRGRAVRDAYVARPGHRLVLCDYDGMELRFMAADAGCAAMIEAFNRGEDVHRWTAAQIYVCAPGEVTRGQRDVTKNAGFAKIYGAGVDKFAATAEIDVNQAADFLARYDELFPEVAAWQQGLIDGAARTRSGREWPYVETLLGRRLPIEPDKLYKATNFRDQGSCAEIAKMAVNRLHAAGLGGCFRLFVHDEVILEAPEDDADEVRAEAERVMHDGVAFPALPFTASGEVVERWGAKYGSEPNPIFVEAP